MLRRFKKGLGLLMVVCMIFTSLFVAGIPGNTALAAAHNYYYFDLDNYLKTNTSCFYPTAFDGDTSTGRYVRLSVNTPNQYAYDFCARVQELELYYNVALGKTATVSDSNSNIEGAAQGVDGNITTHWCSTGTGNRWLTIDLGSSQTIKKWIVKNAQAGGEPASYNTKDYKLQSSTDGTTFVDVDTVTGNTAAITDRNLAGKTARYFRLYVTTPNQVAGDNVIRIREFELYLEGNMAQGKTVTTSSNNSSGESGAQAVDGNITTHWCSSPTNESNKLVIDLGTTKKINRWVVKNAGANGEEAVNNMMSYSLEISTDGVNYSQIDGVGPKNTDNITDRMIIYSKATKYAYDFIKMVSAFQGLVNRNANGPWIFIHYTPSGEIAKPRGFDADNFWESQLQTTQGSILGGTKTVVTNFYSLFATFPSAATGLVTWDEAVPSTSNVASTVAGCDNLIPVRYDTATGSVYNELISNTSLQVTTSLVNKFTGSGTIPDTSVASTGSKKCDAYIWAKVKYIDTQKVSPTLMTYSVDAFTPYTDGSGNKYYSDGLDNRMLVNADYYIKNKAFFFDLQPEKNPASPHLPNDEPTQPLGADVNTLTTVLNAMQTNANGQIITVGGFAAWHIKYSTLAFPKGQLEPIDTEWAMIDMLSSRYMQLDADAPGLMALSNASIYQYVQLNTLTQNNGKGSNYALAYDPNKRYVMFYMGDYDSAAWTADEMPALWNRANGRGRIPLAWSVVPNLADRVPMAYNYYYSTATSNDFFISGDNGAGYINPALIPSGNMNNWVAYNKSKFGTFDMSIAGFVICDYATYLDTKSQEAISSFAPDGVGTDGVPQNSLFNGVPQIAFTGYNGGQGITEYAGHTPKNANWVEQGLKVVIDANINSRFFPLRTVLTDPDILADGYEQYVAHNADKNVEVVDPYTFFKFYKQSLGTSNTPAGVVSIQANANSKYACADNYGNSPLIANRTTVGQWETYDLVSVEGNKIALKSRANSKYVTADPANPQLIANSTEIGDWEKFTLTDAGSGLVSIKANSNGKYVTSSSSGTTPLIANVTTVGTTEKFRIQSTISYKIQNKWQPTKFMNIEANNGYTQCDTNNLGDSAKWYIHFIGDGRIKLSNYWQTGQSLNIETNQTYVQSNSSFSGDSAKWILEDAGAGYYKIKNYWKGTYMGIPDQLGYVQEGNYGGSGYDSATWRIIPN